MIVTGLLKLLAKFFLFIISFFPANFALPVWFDKFLDILQVGLYFFPADVLVIVMGNVFFCNLALILWAIVEWVLKKIPGVS